MPLGSRTAVSKLSGPPASRRSSAPSASGATASIAGSTAPSGVVTAMRPPARMALTEPALPVISGVAISSSPPLRSKSLVASFHAPCDW
ncbi:hypothetical protein ACEN8K_36610 [Variovorax sp. CT11-76]